jgi:hypothetical protein
MKPTADEARVEWEEPSGPAALWAAWDRFWFKPADPTTLGFIRIWGGALILYVHIAYTFGLLDYVGPQGYIDDRAASWLCKEYEIYTPPTTWTGPATLAARGHVIWSIYFHVTDPFWIYTIHFSILAAMLLFTVGLWTRVTSVLTLLGTLCYLHRAPTTLFGMDTMMNLLVVYLTIGPSGAALSLDRWLEVRRARRLGRPAPLVPLASANFALRCMQINFCFIYMASGTSKLLGAAWWNGTAIWSTLANYSFAPMYLQWYRDFLVWLAQHRIIWEIFMSGGALFTLALEISFSFLVWEPKLRWFMLCGAVMLHTGIALSMGLVTFSLMMLCLVFAFVPPQAVHHLLDRLRGRASFQTRPLDRAEALAAKARQLEATPTA